MNIIRDSSVPETLPTCLLSIVFHSRPIRVIRGQTLRLLSPSASISVIRGKVFRSQFSHLIFPQITRIHADEYHHSNLSPRNPPHLPPLYRISFASYSRDSRANPPSPFSIRVNQRNPRKSIQTVSY